MLRSNRSLRATTFALAVLLIAAVSPVAAADTTPPTGTAWLDELYPRQQVFDLRLGFTDAESGIDHVTLRCDDLPEVTRDFEPLLRVPYFDPSQGGCEDDGEHWIWVTAYNGDGLSTVDAVRVHLAYALDLVVSDNPTTGEPITITPTYPEPYELPTDAYCEWEIRWGNNAAILENDFNWSFGSLLIGGEMEDGFCGPWTFTLPYVPVPRFQVRFELESETRSIINDKIGFRKDGSDVLVAEIGSTERRITESTLPVMMVLPDAYVAEVNKPITYRLYPAGGAEWDGNDGWIAAFEAGEHLFTKEGGGSFTFTPDRIGDWVVFWNAQGQNEPYALGAGFDPPAKRADNVRPNTTAPVTKLDNGIVGATVPADVTWKGSDSGWGVESYRIQRSIDGGAWGGGRTLRRTKADWDLAPGHSYRFRVRAKDLAGNKGAWDVGPTIRAAAVQESADALAFSSGWDTADDADAWGGHMRRSDTAGATIRYAFTGRGIAWVAGRDPSFGKAKVYVDGNLVATVNLEASSPAARGVVWSRSWSARDAHRLRIVVVGNGAVDVDGFVVLR